MQTGHRFLNGRAQLFDEAISIRPTPLAETRSTARTDSSSCATPRLARTGPATNPPANFRHDLVWPSRVRKCATARPTIYLPGRRRETELPRDWRGSMNHGLVVDQLRARVETFGEVGSSENSATRGRRGQSEAACFRRRSPPPNPRNPAQCRRSIRRFWRIVARPRARS